MFKKLLSNLPYNPSLITQVGFYTKRLKQESFVRGLGVTAMILALFVQTFAVISPPEQSLAQGPNDIIDGGFASQSEAVSDCKNNTQDFKTILAYYKITCDRLADSSKTSTVNIKSTDHNKTLTSLGRVAQGPEIYRPLTRKTNPTNEYTVNIPELNYPLYMRNLWAWDSYEYSTYKVLKTTNLDGDTMYILYNCGNIVTVGKYVRKDPGTFACKSLNVVLIKNLEYEFTAVASKERATITKYEFKYGDGSSVDRVSTNALTATRNHTFPAYNKIYNASVDVYAEVANGSGGTDTKVDTCIATVSTDKEFTVGTADCELLTPEKLADLQYRFTATASRTNARITEYKFFYGDGTTKTITVDDKLTAEQIHEYQEAGTYVVKVRTFYKAQQKDGSYAADSIDCQTKLEVEPPDVCPNLPGIQTDANQCYPCPEAEGNDNADACLEFEKTARNETQGIDNAHQTTAKASDVIWYTLNIKNNANETFQDFIIKEDLRDVLEYADIQDFGGGELNNSNQLIWPAKDIAAGDTYSVTFATKVKAKVPQTPTSSSDQGSYDLCMANVFYGDAVTICVDPPTNKRVEAAVTTLPNTGPGETMAAAVIMVGFMGYFFARNKLMVEELTVVRDEFASGGTQ